MYFSLQKATKTAIQVMQQEIMYLSEIENPMKKIKEEIKTSNPNLFKTPANDIVL